MNKILVAFQKKDPTVSGKLIRFFTRSKYSHVAIVIDGKEYSSDFMRGGVYVANHQIDPFVWDYIEVDNVNIKNILDFYQISKYDGYDFSWPIRRIIPFRDNPDKWICSKWVANALKIADNKRFWKLNPDNLLPKDIFKILS